MAWYSSRNASARAYRNASSESVIPVLPPREAAGRDRGDEPLLRRHLGQCRLEVRKIGAHRLLADIGDRAGEHRRPPAERTRRAKTRGVELGVELGKFLPVAPAGERRQPARLARLPAAEARPGIARPRAVIDGAEARLAELAIVDHIDAEFGLLAADLLDRGRQPFGVKLLVIGLAGKFRAVDFEQRLRPRQAPGMRRQNASIASLHGFRPSQMANPVLRLAVRRRVWLTSSLPPRGTGPTAKARGARGSASSWRPGSRER